MKASLSWSVMLLAGVAACGDAVAPESGPSFGVRQWGGHAADTLRAPSEASYIVVLRGSVRDADGVTDELIRNHGGRVHRRYRSALSGFAATLPTQAVEAIRRNPQVELVEADGIASVSGPQLNPPSWGLDRVDARPLPLDGVYAYQNEGAGVRIYILDTGISFLHPEYQGRAGSGWDFIDNDADASDCHGHGTHVAGTAAGTTVGIAKAATLVSVRVLNCSGSGAWSQVIAGIDWLIANHVKPAVANLSLGGGYSSAVNTAVANAVAAGITFAVAAGNSNANACGFSPASAPSALTVGATTKSDARAWFSNYGGCVDLFAPGAEIYSSVQTGGYESWNGTSMASPHVAGVAALYLASNPDATPAQVSATILDGATLDRIPDAALTGSPNRLLFSQIAGDAILPPLPPPPPPLPGEIRVADLAGASAPNKGGWMASVNVLVQDLAGNPIPNAAVEGSWSAGGTGKSSCTTGSDGRCLVIKSGFKKTVASAKFSISQVSASGKVYTGSNNTDLDGDSNGTEVTVRKP